MTTINKFKNKTHNQHYISQVEQRFNAINPSISNDEQEIYSFPIIKDGKNLRLSKPNIVKIKDNFSFTDLYTFDNLDAKIRYNLENFYNDYESKLRYLTSDLIEKINSNDNITQELIEIFRLKLLNSFRNPYCIEKTLNTFKDLLGYIPCDSELNNIYQKIELQLNNNEIEDRARQLNINKDVYIQWLKLLLRLLCYDFPNGQNIFDKLVDSLFTNSEIISHMRIDYYTDEKYVTLSDRSFLLFQNNSTQVIYQFNLSATLLLSFTFTRIDENVIKDFFSEDIKSLRDINYELIKERLAQSEIPILKDDLKILSKYNNDVIAYSHSEICCKSENIYLGN